MSAMASALPRAVIKSSTMTTNIEMQEAAIDVAQKAIMKNYTDKDVAASVRKSFQKKYPTSTWHCLVGRDFGCFVSHKEACYIYFYIGQQVFIRHTLLFSRMLMPCFLSTLFNLLHCFLHFIGCVPFCHIENYCCIRRNEFVFKVING